jgi:hypothetical protein
MTPPALEASDVRPHQKKLSHDVHLLESAQEKNLGLATGWLTAVVRRPVAD